jgi:hypothetical protein
LCCSMGRIAKAEKSKSSINKRSVHKFQDELISCAEIRRGNLKKMNTTINLIHDAGAEK